MEASMKKPVSHGTLVLLSFLFIVSMVLSSCGSGPTPSASSGTGMVAVLLTDGPTDKFSEVRVTITEIELIGRRKHVTVFSGSQTLNLLDLENEIALVALASDVPAGRYRKIRLRVTDVQLFDLDGMPITKPRVKIAGNGKLDLKPRRPFVVEPGETITVKLDFDARKCLKLNRRRNMYTFRPVIFTKVSTTVAAAQEEFVRVTGTALNIDGENGTFELSMDEGLTESSSTPVLVDTSGGPSFFAESFYGSPAVFGDLQEGSAVTVIGTMTADSQALLDAAVVEIGMFRKITGTIISDLDPVSGQFGFLPDPGQDVADVPHSVVLQTGTGIYSSEGEALEETALTEGTRVEVDGVVIFVDMGPTIINAAFVSVETAGLQEQAIEGTVSAASMDAQTPEPCVSYAGDMDVLLITSGSQLASIEYASIEDIEDGEDADLYGTYDAETGCFITDTVVVEREE
jgi:hypothetical protein